MSTKTVLRMLLAVGTLILIGVAFAWRDQLNLAVLQTWVDGAGAAVDESELVAALRTGGRKLTGDEPSATDRQNAQAHGDLP